VTITVIDDGDDHYVATAYAYQLTGETVEAGLSNFSGCSRVTATASNLTDDAIGFIFDKIHFRVADVTDEADILANAKEIFKDDDIEIKDIKDSQDGDWQDVSMDCTTNDVSGDCMTFNFRFELRYYKDQGKLFYIALGQAGNLFVPGNEQQTYDQAIVDSFKLLDD
jgi:hypothetical protein